MTAQFADAGPFQRGSAPVERPENPRVFSPTAKHTSGMVETAAEAGGRQ
jgi:hypothetical protein